MLAGRHFRQEAITNRCRDGRPDDLLRVTAPHEWMTAGLLGLVLLGCLVWVLFGSVERTLTASCALTNDGARHAIIAGYAGTAVDVAVAAGDRVQRGQTLARLRRPDIDLQVDILRARLQMAEARLQEADQLQQLRAELDALSVAAELGGLIRSHVDGEVTALDIARGDAVVIGMPVAEILEKPSPTKHAVTVFNARDAARLTIGAPSEITIRIRDSAEDWQGMAVVSEISSGEISLPDWVRRANLSHLETGHLVRLDFDPPPPPMAKSGTCRMRLVTQRSAPIELLFSQGSG